MIHVIGGIYREKCLKPSWDEIFGSGGRAALAIANMNSDVHLHSYIPKNFQEEFNFKVNLIQENAFEITSYNTTDEITFDYNHGLDPLIPPRVDTKANIILEAENILIFGMLECASITKSEFAVYDPQNTFSTESFSKYGSRAKHLALVLNESEARILNNSNPDQSLSEVIKSLHTKESAEVIVVKRGPEGAIVSYHGNSHIIPVFKTNKVWKIGSGDCFSAHFAFHWMKLKEKPEIAAKKASIATSYFCETSVLPAPFMLENYNPIPITIPQKSTKKFKTVYIASPFFTLSQLWLVEQIRFNLQEMGMKVISPYHDIGLVDVNHSSQSLLQEICHKDLEGIDSSDIIFGVTDGSDVGTLVEIGYAVALNKKIILLCENVKKNDLTMFHHENIEIIDDYVTAIYKTLWTN